MATNIVPELLAEHNYPNWSACIRNYLLANDLWDIIEANFEPPGPKESEAEFRSWRRKNAAILHAIQVSCTSIKLSQIREIDSAKVCWDTLATIYKQQESEVEDDSDPVSRSPLSTIYEQSELEDEDEDEDDTGN
ncbi:hypothetical protein JCGZ_23937 [Jatropha curcas]|uniref:Uncharacterized protein n=1 Tax=Jatropha curcas TaxID=180498 RepID=A0A067JP54_JATCU|nr:hypothetical protein JCGZ_23937 [Jatropha curcas]